ncbi:MAG: two-component system, NtrC family, sensor kinase [Chthoniobacter sp.]|nr:two-component system, NtrC family, sensor kinase [Chthoniobacter sp.]
MWAYIPLVGAICNSLLVMLVLARGARTTVLRVYTLLGIGIVIWNVGTFFMFQAHDKHDALFWARFLQLGVIFIPLALFHLSLLVADVPVGRYIGLLYIFVSLLAVSNLTGHFISDVHKVGYAYYSVGDTIPFKMFMMTFALVYGSVFVLIRKRRRLPPLHRKRLTGLILAQGLLATLGLNDVMPILKIYTYPGTEMPIYPFGSMAAIFYGLMVGYSVLQHQLLDIQLSLSKVAALAVRVLFLCFIGLTILLICTLIDPARFNAVSFFSALLSLALSGTISAIFFPRLFGGGGENLERRILGDRFEYHDQIRSFTASMQWYSDMGLLLSDLHELLTKTVRVRSYEIILLDETTRTFSLFRAYPERPDTQLPELHTDSPVFQFFKKSRAEYLAFNLLHGDSGSQEIELASRESLRHFGAEFCFPFLSEEEPIGMMLLGGKTNDEPYTATDIRLMVALVKNLSLMINQIRLKNQIQHAQELELLGRMSRGMAHDLNNLLTPVWTLLQLVNEGISSEDLSEELLPVALRNIKVMRAYVRESLFFSENLRPDFQLGRLDMQISQAIDLNAARRSAKQINVVADTPGEVLVEMDEVLIQRLIGNIIANGIDASPPQSTIRVELLRLVKTEVHRDWLRVRVIDAGEGIKQENLNRIFTPYFTTKDRGDKDRGFGLGLAICRKIVNLHGGNLNVFSQVGKGTTVQIDLPSRQAKQTTPAMITK